VVGNQREVRKSSCDASTCRHVEPIRFGKAFDPDRSRRLQTSGIWIRLTRNQLGDDGKGGWHKQKREPGLIGELQEENKRDDQWAGCRTELIQEIYDSVSPPWSDLPGDEG
jgi:hypothetical protein